MAFLFVLPPPSSASRHHHDCEEARERLFSRPKNFDKIDHSRPKLGMGQKGAKEGEGGNKFGKQSSALSLITGRLKT